MNNIEILKTDKFKNNILSIVIPVELDNKVTGYNVLLNILKRGSKTFSSSSKISTYLQDMYGANMVMDISKRGDKLFISFFVSFIHKDYTLYEEDLWGKAIYLLNDIIYNPNLVNGRFEESIVNQEIENHKREISSKYDDKTRYSLTRLIENGMNDEYKVPEYGTLEDLEKIDNDFLVEIYKELTFREIFIYAAGNIDDKEKLIKKLEKVKQAKNKDVIRANIKTPSSIFNFERKEVKEYMKISQGKISSLYDTKTTVFDKDYFAFSVFNSIFGGGPHSKLFNDIREKNSLCYYIFSSYDKFKGIMTVLSGVESKNFDKVNKLIDKNIKEMQNGDFTENDIEIAKTKIINSIKAMEDSMFRTINYLISLKIYGVNLSVDDVIDGIKKVTKDEIINVAKKISHVSTHYLVEEELEIEN